MLVTDELEIAGPDNAFAYLWNNNTNLQNLIAYCEDETPGLCEYKLTITDSLGCQWADSIKIDFYVEPDYADLSKGERLVTIYPNPVKESFNWTLETNKEAKMAIEILDGAGNVHFYQKIERYQPGQQMKAEVSNLAPGIYYFCVISNGDRITKKFVKQ